MSAVATLKFMLVAKNEASGALKTVGGDAEHAGGKLSGMGRIGKAALLGVGAAAVGFGVSAIGKFQQVTGEARTLQRALGGTIEDASRWAFAAKQSGVDTGTFTKSIQKFDKALVVAGGSAKTNAAMVKTLGFNYRDAHGQILPMNTLLPKLSDRFAKMPDGADKTALALKLFGKAGASLLPFLGKGSAGIAALRKETDKYGLTITEKNVKAMAAAKVAQRQFSAALDGVKVQIGAFLLPIMTKLTVFVQSFIIPAIQKVTGYFRDHSTQLKIVGLAFGALVVTLGIYKVAMIASSIATKVQAVATGVWTAAQWLLNAALDANPIGLIVLAVATLTAGIIWIATKTNFFKTIWHAAWGAIKSSFEFVYHFIKDHWKLILAIITGPIGLAVLFVTSHWQAIKDGFMGVVHFIGGKVTSIVGFITGIPGKIVGAVKSIGNIGAKMGSALWHGITHIVGDVGGFGKSLYNAVASSINWLIDKIKNWHFTIGAFGLHHTFQPFGGIPEIPLMAKGGIVSRPTLAVIGEAGPEAVVPLNRMHSFGVGGGARSTVIQVIVQGALSTKREIAQAVKSALEQDLNGGGTMTVRSGAIRVR